MKYIVFATVILILVVILSAIYKILPHRSFKSKKPYISFFPKYHFSYRDLDSLKLNLSESGFKQSSNPNLYARGSFFGDFLLKWAKLNVVIDPQKKEARVHSPLTVILVDTGDTWKLVSMLSK